MDWSGFVASFLFGLLFIFVGLLLFVAWRFATSVVTAIELTPNEDRTALSDEDGSPAARGLSPQFVELVVYLCFVTTFCVTMVASRDPGTYTTHAALTDMFLVNEFRYGVRFQNLRSRAEVLDWVGAVVVPNVYPTTRSNFGDGAVGKEARQYLADGVSYRVGPLRLRTVRVRGSESRLTKYLGDDRTTVGNKAYPGYAGPWSCDYGSSNEDTSDFGTFEYKAEPNAPVYFSTATRNTYCGGGQVFEFPESAVNATAAWETLKATSSDFLLGAPVRALVVEFATYNANADLHTLLRAVVEVLPSGTLVSTAQIVSVPLSTMAGTMEAWSAATVGERAFLAMEFGLYLQVFALLILNMVLLKRLRMRYLASLWHLASAACVVTTTVVSCYRASNAAWARANFEDLAWRTTFPTDLAARIVAYQRVDEIAAIATILLFVRMFKYLAAYRSLAQFWNTVVQAASEILPICIILFIILVGYASAFYTAFGSELATYKDFASSLRAMWRAMLGDIDPTTLLGPRRPITNTDDGFTGLFLFISFVFLTIFVVLSMFLSIVDQAYEAVQHDLDARDPAESQAFTAELYLVATFPMRCLDHHLERFLEWAAGVKLDHKALKDRRPKVDAAFSSVIEFQKLQHLGVLSGTVEDAYDARTPEEVALVVFADAASLLEKRKRLFDFDRPQLAVSAANIQNVRGAPTFRSARGFS